MVAIALLLYFFGNENLTITELMNKIYLNNRIIFIFEMIMQILY